MVASTSRQVTTRVGGTMLEKRCLTLRHLVPHSATLRSSIQCFYFFLLTRYNLFKKIYIYIFNNDVIKSWFGNLRSLRRVAIQTFFLLRLDFVK